MEGEPGRAAAPSTSPDHADALALALIPVYREFRAGRGFPGGAGATDGDAVQRMAGLWLPP